MSVYTSITMDSRLRESLNIKKLQELNEKLTGNCGYDDYNSITQEELKFKVTYNHNLDKALDILEELQQYLYSDEPIIIGEFKSEAMSAYSGITNIYLYKDRLYFLSYETKDIFVVQVETYNISTPKGVSEQYTAYSDEGVTTEQVVKKFSEKQGSK